MGIQEAGLERQRFDVIANADPCIQIFKRRNRVRELSASARRNVEDLVGSVDPVRQCGVTADQHIFDRVPVENLRMAAG